MKIFVFTAVAFIAVAWTIFGGPLQSDMVTSPDKAIIGVGQAFVDAVSRLLFS